MNPLNDLIKELGKLIADKHTDIEVRAASLVELAGPDSRNAEFYQDHEKVRSIVDIAINIVNSPGTEHQLGVMWAEIEHEVKGLLNGV